MKNTKHAAMLSLLLSVTGCLQGPGTITVEDPQHIAAPSTVTSRSNFLMNFDSKGLYNASGRTEVTKEVGLHRPLIIPAFVFLVGDSSHNIQVGDRARIYFNNSMCQYKYNGTNFEFRTCSTLSSLSGAQHRDVIYLRDHLDATAPETNGKVSLGLYRGVDLGEPQHVGTIKLSADFQ